MGSHWDEQDCLICSLSLSPMVPDRQQPPLLLSVHITISLGTLPSYKIKAALRVQPQKR